MELNKKIIVLISTIFLVLFIGISTPNIVFANDSNIEEEIIEKVNKEEVDEDIINKEDESTEEIKNNSLVNESNTDETEQENENIEEDDFEEAEKKENNSVEIQTEDSETENTEKSEKLESVEKEEESSNNQTIEKKTVRANLTATEEKKEEPKIEYSSHIQGSGWEEDFSKSDGETSGTEGQNRRIEAIKIRLENTEELSSNVKVKYKVHTQDYGWMDWKQNGEIAGTIGESKRIEAIRIKLEGTDEYSVRYRTYVESLGWIEWVNNGEASGTEGKGLRIEALQIKLVKNPKTNIIYVYDEEKNTVIATVNSSKIINEIVDDGWKISKDKLSASKEYDVNDRYSIVIKDSDNIEKQLDFEIDQIIEPTSTVKYSSHVSGYGWEKKFSKIDGDISGFEKKDKGIEAIQIALGNSEVVPSGARIYYQTYSSETGWQKWVSDGEMSGSTAQSRSIEAIKMNITGMDGYVVEYRVYIEGNGWQKWKKNAELAGTVGKYLEIQGIQIQIKRNDEATIEPTVVYQTHVQNIGWQNVTGEDGIAGTTGRSLGIEAIIINVNGLSGQTNIKYQTHVQNIGWQRWYSNNETAGTTGQSKSIEAIRIVLENSADYSIEYRVHISGYGWQKWRKNGEEAGTTGLSRRLEAIEMRIVYKDTETVEPELIYRAHVQDYGWQNYAIEGFTTGTEGQAKRVEALRINLIGADSNAKVLYRAHVQDIGWQGWSSNDALAGTTGQAKRIEAIQVKLEGLDDYTVEYKVHIQDYGWTGWMIDGETAGTTGRAKRIEAIQMRITPKYYREYYGIDVSSHNGDINWQAVKNSGVQFAMIRCAYRGYGTGKIADDTKFEKNIKNAINSGVNVGIYFFSQAMTPEEGIEEANYAINLAKKYKVTYPIAIDSEMSGDEENDGRADHLTPTQRTNAIVAFCNQVSKNGYVPMVYASRDWFYSKLEMDKLSNYEIWLAHYTGSSNLKSNFKYGYTMFQYTSVGSVSGIGGNVDLNVGYKKY